VLRGHRHLGGDGCSSDKPLGIKHRQTRERTGAGEYIGRMLRLIFLIHLGACGGQTTYDIALEVTEQPATAAVGDVIRVALELSGDSDPSGYAIYADIGGSLPAFVSWDPEDLVTDPEALNPASDFLFSAAFQGGAIEPIDLVFQCDASGEETLVLRADIIDCVKTVEPGDCIADELVTSDSVSIQLTCED
jgi:hypothetical protein